MKSGFAGSTVKILLVLFSCLAAVKALVTKEIDENKDKGYIVHTFPSPLVGKVYTFFQAKDEELANALKLFQISTSGVVKTTKPIFFEIGKANSYDLVALERPPGATEGGVATSLRVKIKDTNNFNPTFPADIYDGWVKEQSSENVLVEGLEDCFAEDRDQSGMRGFKISSGNDKGYFKTDKKKVGDRLFLILKTTATKIVRDDATPNIILTVRAEDGVRYGSTKIRINILDFNDNEPEFGKNPYSETIAENTPLMTSVLRVRAIDKDVGANGGIYYYLKTLSDYFSVDAITGVIKVVQELDYQAKSSHSLTVVAKDRGNPSKSSQTLVEIKIQDMPNFPRPPSSNPGRNTKPFFPDGPYTANVREDLPVKAALLVIHALDRDPAGSTDSVLSYRILSGASGKFEINPRSGVVTLSNTLDYESLSSYVLEVEARDGGGEKATTALTIKVQDVDENRYPPTFSPQQRVVSIDENQAVGTQVVQVSASDRDQGQDGQVVYSAVKGSGLRFFEVDQSSGVVKTAAPLDREETSFYELMIEARDKATFPLVAYLYLMINVGNADDYTPDFSQPMYSAKVPEKADRGTFVTVVHAVDRDGPSFSYQVTGGAAFTMESETGVITTSRILDPSQGETSFTLQVIARNGKQADALVNVTVTSRSDSPPAFKESTYKVSVPENQGHVDSLLCIAAIDPLGRPAKYSIAAPSDGRFSIISTSGKFGATSSFDYESVAEGKFTMEVRATSGKNQQAASTNVVVTIQDTRDPPTFEKNKFEINVNEDSGGGTTLSNGLLIVDQDTSKNNFICSLEKITSIDVIDTFKVVNDQGQCKLVTQARIDHYTTPQFSFEVRATDKSYLNMYASADVVVKVIDKNNHAPVFSQSSYWVSVQSTLPKDSTVLTVKAVDKDAGTNGDFVYQLVNSQDSQRFDLSGNNGVLKSASSLAANNKYQLKIKAVDKSGKSSEVTVYVSVYGPSVNHIQFSKDSYSTEQMENVKVNTAVLTVKASGRVGITYAIVGGNEENVFKISSGGVISVAKALDRERTPEYKLAVRASTSGGSGGLDLATEVICTITVKDVNDNSPRFAFTKIPKEVSVDSYSSVGTKVLEVKALDKDAGSFGKVTYDIDTANSDPTDPPFTIGSKSGLLEVSRNIPSKANRASYKVIVEATDGGGKSSTAEVRVTVNDVKPPPKFSSASYEVTVPENGKVGDTVKNIKAIYGDNSALLKYKIVSGNTEGTFCINRDGLITIARPLDREEISNYELKVEVRYGNSKGTTTVKVGITDINDDTPHFTQSVYTFEVDEDTAPNGVEVGKVTATDFDTGTNGEIGYRILYSVDARSYPGLFEIKPVGVISTKRNIVLDYERIKQHVLYVRASDNGSPSLKEIAKVIINVKDINDNKPRFSAQSYSAKVPLDAKTESHILQVTATDLDSGVNGQVQYSITNGNEEGAFKINPNNGFISLKKSLTTVSASQFRIAVLATDMGEGRNNGTATVQVSVYLPDGPPKFVDATVVAKVEEGVRNNERVLVVKAATSEALIYEIVSGNADGMFRIVASTGEIKATRTLDYEEKREYRIEVRARDTRDRTAVVNIIIKVKNINDNRPVFPGQMGDLVERKVEGKFQVGDPVARLTAFDKDGEKITYRILSPSSTKSYFMVDDDGFLRSRKSIDDLPSPYEFRMEARDSGNPPKATTVDVRLIFVHYRPYQQPVRVDVLESETVGSIIATVPRYFPGSSLSLIYPHNANFSVDDNGKLSTTGPLDYEEQKFYSLTIREKEPTAPFRNNDVDIEINVIDVNDNKPVFTMPDLFGRVNTNARPGTSAYQPRATDEDDASNGIVGYQLVTHNQVFVINPFQNTVETGNVLGSDGSYKVELFAFDYGIPRQESDVISIEIKTVKFPPRFSKNLYIFNVSEAAFGGKVVGQVKATSSSRARLSFSIVQGDSEKKFRAKPDGVIVVNYFLDHEKQSLYSLKVRAEEQILQGYSSETDVQIKVINANDHYPRFTKSVYPKSVREDATGSVLKVKAQDCDCSICECPNGLLKYSLSGTEFFKVDSDTGDISVSKPLDFERQTVHVFRVSVRDFGEKKTYTDLAYVRIEVLNVNDNEPAFAEEEYRTGISENAEPSKSLAAVLATDADGDQLSYSISSGGGDIFKIDQNSGVISLAKKLPSGSQIQYTLQVRATDPEKKYQEVRLVVEVEDSNNHAPVFTACTTAKVAENLPAGKRVTKVVAEDKNDRGRNKEIEYSLKHGGERLFRIDNATGEIFTESTLDRERSKSYSLTVQAEDGGHGRNEAERLLSYCFLEITVEDKNDNYPEFLSREYLGSVWHKSPVGTTILTVSATDVDDDANSQVEYSFVGLNDLFLITSGGAVRTKTALTNNLQTTRLTVRAKNRKSMETGQRETRNSKTTIEITVTDKKPPKCGDDLFTFRISEKKAVDEKVGIVSAQSQTGSTSIAYSLVKDNPNVEQAFQVRPDGEIRTGGQLDYERIKEYTLQIRAKETDTNLYSTCVAKIRLDDENDDAPNFQLEDYYARVPENAGSGFKVVTVKATDKDDDGRAKVTYSIDDKDKLSDYQFFAINQDSGVITTKRDFDRETKARYNLIVIASDKNTKPEVRVEVNVVDVNDVAPKFSQANYEAKVSEDAGVGTSVTQLSATDGDIGENARLDYFVSAGSGLQKFKMETVYGKSNYGVLILDGSLDYETLTEYTIYVTATDRKDSTSAKVTIKVLDANDNTPEFTELIYDTKIPEESGAGVLVQSVTATDRDSATIQNALKYSLDANGKKYFKINEKSGTIVTSGGKLDRELSPYFVFSVYAFDGKHRGKAAVRVELSDINDNAPVFPSPPYVGYVLEHKPKGESVMVVEAVDRDDGINSNLVYSLVENPGNRFKIDYKGLLSTTKELDRETTPNEFTVTVKATDSGSPSKSGTTRAKIIVADANDQKPKFTKEVYRGAVAEDALPGYSVTEVSATDADEGFNAELEYSIIKGNDPSAFYLDPRTGKTYVSGLLDYDKGKKVYELTVIVRDRGLPPLQADKPAKIVITIGDANDNAPRFVPDSYRLTLAEDFKIGETLLKVTAVDHDSGSFAAFNFSIGKGDESNIFGIKPDSKNGSIGLIYTFLELDRETALSHNLTIVATDLAGLTGTATVYLTIADVNDNGPWFVPPYFEAEVRENVNTRQFVTTISAMDPDESSNGPPFSFNIVNVTSRFSIARDSDLTAKIHSSGSFDREAKPRWTLKVKGTDSGSPRKTNETYVYIKIKDDNDNEPFDGELFIFVNVYRGKFDGGVIGKPYYKDEDSDGDVNEYKITSQSGSYFTIDSRSGNITARRGMPVGSYSLTVDVTEQNRRSGSNTGKTVTSQIKVVLRPIPEAAVQNSVAVQFLHVRKVSFFVGDFYLNVQSTLARMLGVSDDRLLIFSIQKAPLRHLPVGAFSAVEIQLAVEIVESEVYMTFLEIVKKLTQQKKQLINLGLVVGDIGIDECAREYQDVGKCENVVRTSSKFTVASGDYGKIPAPGTSLTIVSMDVVLKGEYSAIFPLTYDCSTNNPCLHGGTCHTAVPKGTVICECARGYTGPHCEWSTRTFYGNSYIWLAALTAYERSEVSMTFITKDANGLLLYQGPLYTGANNGLGDFMAVMMVGGYIQLKMTLGPHPSAPLVMYMDRGYRLDDGNWHIVQVSRQLKVVKVIIDKCEKAQVVAENGRVFEDRRMCEMEADVWGSSLYLNGFGPLQIGGVQNEVEGLSIQYKGFKGCIRNIYDNGDMYDLESPPKVVNAPKGCEFARRCPNCNGHGYCEPLWNVHSICVCDLGFSGINCNGRSQANWYTPGSFSQYKVKQKRRKRRELVPPPVSMSNGFYSNIALQVKVEPTPKEVVIFLASNSLGTEFNRIDVNNGVIRYIFRLGDRMKILKIPEFNITDGKYHSVVVKREGNRASMQIDYEGKVEGTTGGIHKLLNMGSGSFFAGGMPNITELRIVQAWVKSGGNAILRGADGSVVSSGLGAGASGVLSGSTFVGTMIDIGSLGEVRTKSYSSTKKVTLTGYVAVQSSYKIIIGHGGVGGGTGLGSQGGAVVRNVQIKTSSSSGSSSSAGGGVSSAGGGSASGGGTVTGAAGGSSSAGGGGGGGGVAGSGGLGIGGSGATGGIGLGVWEYGAPTPMVLGAGSSVGASADGAVHVFGDFGGCTAENRYNGADLESDPSIIVERQNVAFGCPCESGFCFHAGTCVNAAPPYCLCAPGWSGPRCEDVVKAPNPGTRPGSLWRNNAVIAIMLVVFFAILFIVGAAILKRRKPPVVVVTEDGHVHDNVRPYHDEGAGEEDNFGYDIHQLMKYTYIESGAPDGLGVGVPGPFTRRPGAGEEEITVAEDKPLLRGAMDSTGKHAGVTSIRKQRLRNPESVDVGTFIDTRVSEADEEYVLSVDELHVYRYEGDDSDVDDLSELGSDDEEQEDEQDFAFLGTLGRKFDNLNRIFNEDD